MLFLFSGIESLIKREIYRVVYYCFLGPRNALLVAKTNRAKCKTIVGIYRGIAEKIMKEILDKLKFAVQVLEKEQGPMLLFALFLREDSLEKWDIVVSASWLSSTEKKAYKMVISKIQAALSPSELVQFARVVILDNTDPVVSFLQKVCPLTNGGYKESPRDFLVEPFSEKFRFTIKKAYILRCQKP